MAEHQYNIRQLSRWAWRACSGQRLRVGTVIVLGLIRVAASLTFVWLSKILIDTAVDPASAAARIWWLAAALTGCMLAELALTQANIYLTTITSTRLANTLRHRLYSHLLESDIQADTRHSGDVLNRLTVDITTLVNTIVVTIPSIISMCVQLGAAFWLLWVMNPTLALCALLITPLAVITGKSYVMKMRRVTADIRAGESSIHANVQEGLQHRVVVQTLECAPVMSSRLRALQDTLLRRTRTKALIHAFSRTSVRLGFIAGYLIAFIWSVWSLHDGAITYGMMTAFLQLVGRIQNPISSLSGSLPQLVNTLTAIDRLVQLDDGQAAELPAQQMSLTPPLGVRLRNVTFAYDGQAPVLNDFSHDFTPGSKTVVMGETGAGKSTLSKIILGLLHPQCGDVEVYGADGAVPVSRLTRAAMVYVPQGNSLLEGSIRDNLLLGCPDATDDMIREVLNIAVANFVYDLPEGLDTQCGELGTRLSEGQCQRIAIARALLRRGSIMILDEISSALDPATAATLIKRLKSSYPDSTIIMISHRPEILDQIEAEKFVLGR